MKSPIFYADFIGAHIDLSKLAEVGNAQFFEKDSYWDLQVGFNYRYSDGVNSIGWRRALKKERLDMKLECRNRAHESRNESLEPYLSEIEAGNAGFEMRIVPSSADLDKGYVVFRNESGVLYCVANLQRQIDALIAAWVQWKAVEPEVYAIIRKHLSA